MYYQILPTKIVYPKIPSNIPIDKIDIIIPAMKNGLIKMTIPEKPNSKNQKYYK